MPSLIVGATRRCGLLHFLLRAVALGASKELCELETDELFFAITQHPADACVPGQRAPRRIEDEDGVVPDVLDEEMKELFEVGDRALAPTPRLRLLPLLRQPLAHGPSVTSTGAKRRPGLRQTASRGGLRRPEKRTRMSGLGRGLQV